MKHGDSKTTMVSNPPFLDQIVSLIVSVASPDQIILFGSYARGNNTEKSDIDLLIIKKKLENGHKTLYRSFFNNDIDVAVDLLTIDCDKYNRLKNKIGYIYRTISKERKVIYGAV